jgi:hypothetical protein
MQNLVCMQAACDVNVFATVEIVDLRFILMALQRILTPYVKKY